MKNREKARLGGLAALVWVGALPACAADRADAGALEPLANKAVVEGEGARLEYTVAVHDAPQAAARNDGSGEAHCNYLAAAPQAGDKTFRFADGNQVVFSNAGNNRIQFVAADGAKKQVEDGERVSRKNWWCQEDGVVLFRTVAAPGGNLSGLKVEWFDSRGTRRNEIQVNLPPSGDGYTWSYENARQVDDCLGLSFRVQEGKAAAAQKPAKLVEYKLCPTGI